MRESRRSSFERTLEPRPPEKMTILSCFRSRRGAKSPRPAGRGSVPDIGREGERKQCEYQCGRHAARWGSFRNTGLKSRELGAYFVDSKLLEGIQRDCVGSGRAIEDHHFFDEYGQDTFAHPAPASRGMLWGCYLAVLRRLGAVLSRGFAADCGARLRVQGI